MWAKEAMCVRRGGGRYDMTDVQFPTVSFKEETAVKEKRFDAPDKGAYADTYTATLDLDGYETITGLNWAITNTDGKTATVSMDSAILTGGSYIYGLIITGSGEELDSIAGVKLVNVE